MERWRHFDEADKVPGQVRETTDDPLILGILALYCSVSSDEIEIHATMYWENFKSARGIRDPLFEKIRDRYRKAPPSAYDPRMPVRGLKYHSADYCDRACID